MKEAPATDVDRAALAAIPKLGMTPVEVTLPDWPYDNLDLILFAEAAAAFEEITLNHQLDTAQSPGPRRLAQHLPPVPLPLRRRLRPGRPPPPHGRHRDGPHHDRSRSPPRPLPARRDAHHHQLHRPPLPHPPRRLRRSLRGPQRLGPRPSTSLSQNSPHPAASLTASPSSAASSTKAPSPASASPWSSHFNVAQENPPGF